MGLKDISLPIDEGDICGWEWYTQHGIWETGCGQEIDYGDGEIPAGWEYCPFCGSFIQEEGE